MSVALIGQPVVGIEINIQSMVTIVEELLAGGACRWQDDRWLREQAEANRLNDAEYAGLEALRVRLLEGGTTFLAAISNLYW